MMRSLDRVISLFARNKGLKTIALVLATVTWLYIRDATSFEETFRDIPLTITTPEGWAVQELSTEHVAVSFRGSQADIRSLDRNQIKVQAMARVRSGEPTMVLNLGRANITAPRSVRPLQVTPSEVQVTLDRETEKEVRVEVATLGSLPEGYFVEDSGVSPTRIKIFGPERRLAEVEAVYTQPLDLAGRIRSFSNSIPLAVPSGLLSARMDVQQVNVSFTVTEFTVSREFRSVPVKLMLPPDGETGTTFVPTVVNVTLRGRVNVISNLTDRAVYAFVDSTQLADPSVVEAPVEVTAALSGITVMAVDPPRVRIVRDGGRK